MRPVEFAIVNHVPGVVQHFPQGFCALDREDGVDAIIKTIRESPDPVTVVAIGPVPNIAEALKRDPSIVHNARFVGMHGSIRLGYGGKPTPGRWTHLVGTFDGRDSYDRRDGSIDHRTDADQEENPFLGRFAN